MAGGGDIDAAAAILRVPVQVSQAPVESHAPKHKGTRKRTDWKHEVVDAASLPREFLMPDHTAIGAIVRARKGETNIPGVRVWAERKRT